jgi:hypothetical protein
LESRSGGKFPARTEFCDGIAAIILKQHRFLVISRVASREFGDAGQGILWRGAGNFARRAGNFVAIREFTQFS